MQTLVAFTGIGYLYLKSPRPCYVTYTSILVLLATILAQAYSEIAYKFIVEDSKEMESEYD